jgi:hypothetical protein
MTRYYKETLNQLSKEQLIYLIEQLDHSQNLIGEVCVDESKCHIDSDRAVDKIRGYLYHMPSMYNVTNLKAYLDMKMGKISVYEYRKIIGLDD